MQDVDVLVVGVVLNVARVACAAVQVGHGVASGAPVTSVTTAASVESMSKWVEKLQMVPRIQVCST